MSTGTELLTGRLSEGVGGNYQGGSLAPDRGDAGAPPGTPSESCSEEFRKHSGMDPGMVAIARAEATDSWPAEVYEEMRAHVEDLRAKWVPRPLSEARGDVTFLIRQLDRSEWLRARLEARLSAANGRGQG